MSRSPGPLCTLSSTWDSCDSWPCIYLPLSSLISYDSGTYSIFSLLSHACADKQVLYMVPMCPPLFYMILVYFYSTRFCYSTPSFPPLPPLLRHSHGVGIKVVQPGWRPPPELTELGVGPAQPPAAPAHSGNIGPCYCCIVIVLRFRHRILHK